MTAGAPDAADTSRAPGTVSAPFDVVVLGGGAAGLFAATAAAERGARTLLLERNRRPGVKVLASGGTRCNVTSALPPHEMLPWFGRAGARFLGHALAELPPAAIVRLLDDEGVPTYVERWDKVFPKSDRATDVLQAFLRRLAKSGAVLACGERALEVRRGAGGAFTIATERESFAARRVVLAVGGQSYPKTGSTGDGYAIAAALGHSIVPPRPALVPLVVDVPWVRALTGNALQDVVVQLRDGRGRTAIERRRALLFTHFGLSGPAAMDVSGEVTREAQAGRRCTLHVDVAPDRDAKSLAAELDARIAEQPRRAIVHCVPGELPERVAAALLQAAGVEPERRAAESSRRDREAAVRALKDTPIPIAGALGFDKAEVTAGGVALPEVDPRTMASRVAPGLFVCGEVLDVAGPIGGFNFQAAFSTGRLAGLHAAG